MDLLPNYSERSGRVVSDSSVCRVLFILFLVTWITNMGRGMEDNNV